MQRSVTAVGILLAIAIACSDSGGPENAILNWGTVTLPAYQGVDLENGTFTLSLTTADLLLTPLGDPQHLQLAGNRDYVYFGTTPPSREDCHGGLAQRYWVDTLPSDVYSCIYTSAGHKGYFHFATWPPFGMDSVRIGFVIWAD